nr:hypothetical protein BaRGS_033984 [Batillaria attramentaria]
MDDITGDEQMMDHVTEEEMIEKLRNRGVVDEIMSHLHFSGGAQPLRPATHLVDQDNLNHGAVRRANIDPTRRYLYLKIRGGKAFMDQLAEEDTGQASSASFTLHLHFRGQRFKSRPAPCAVEPSFDEGFLLELHKEGAGPESKVPIGILEADLELFPRSGQVLEENVVRTQLDLERGRQAEQDRRFLEYAKHWWREYLDIKPAHQDRLIKIFALDCEDHATLLCSLLLGFGLDAYVCVTAGNEEFQDAVRQAVPDGQTFKGAPICEEIINCRGDQVRLALRVRIFPYPESACAVWMMFACKYKSVL